MVSLQAQLMSQQHRTEPTLSHPKTVLSSSTSRAAPSPQRTAHNTSSNDPADRTSRSLRLAASALSASVASLSPVPHVPHAHSPIPQTSSVSVDSSLSSGGSLNDSDPTLMSPYVGQDLSITSRGRLEAGSDYSQRLGEGPEIEKSWLRKELSIGLSPNRAQEDR